MVNVIHCSPSEVEQMLLQPDWAEIHDGVYDAMLEEGMWGLRPRHDTNNSPRHRDLKGPSCTATGTRFTPSG